MSTHLILWSCGPVQDLIAAARKGRDLWFGSWLLSELSRAAARTLRDGSAELILPCPEQDELDDTAFDVPNRVLARTSAADPQALAEQATLAAKARLLELAKEVFDKLDDRGHNLYDRAPALEQVVDLLECHWAVTRCTGADRRDRRRVEALLAARKSYRGFAEPSFASSMVPKSSLDGARECVTKQGAGLRLGLGSDERLCGPGLFKRMGHELRDARGGRVLSVSHFALLSWLRPALQGNDAMSSEQRRAKVSAAAEELLEVLSRSAALDPRDLRQPIPAPVLGHLDAHMFYTSRLAEFVGGDPSDTLLNDVRGALRGFRDRVEEGTGVRLPSEPTPYYALLIADGDQLGKRLEACDSFDDIKKISRALSAFAKQVREDIFDEDKLEGSCVYAGGDDVMALVPVDKALTKARELQEAFAQAMTEAGHEGCTLSAGIVVAHHLSPLDSVLAAARQTEQIAKTEGGRGAWAIQVLKRSGSPIVTHGKWADSSDIAFRELAAQSHSTGELPRGLSADWLLVLERLLALQPGADDVPADLAASELRRLLRQKRLIKRDKQGVEQLGKGATAVLHQFENPPPKKPAAEHLLDRLLVARALTGMAGAV